ncbi:type VII secretion protein [Bacillus sp. AFS059628]|uniref:WXG100 family type VII secretion target n=1 Tax=Bacillus sp. AFS059628 TaxID=2033508 RepID=UPI000BF982AD|nr:WXG100 family type VII secretion target [Bacillus sp. AFS059628]PFV68694.1 type VII secretion protein [Bacillus sp. AFS059628]
MVQIKVTPEMLEEVANRANNTRIALESIHNNLCNEIDQLCFQWIGVSNQQFVQMFNDARPKAFTSINSLVKVEEDLQRIAEKFRNADNQNVTMEEGAMCGKPSSEEKGFDGGKLARDIAGEISGEYDIKRAWDGVDPSTGEKLSTWDRIFAGGMAVAGLTPVGKLAKVGKGVKMTHAAIESKNLLRGEDYLKAATRPNGIGKPHIGENGNLIPANKEGMYKGRQVTVTEHILGGYRRGAKHNSPYTSFSIKPEVASNYGKNIIDIDLPALRKGIREGEVKDVAILSPKQIERLIKQDSATTDHWKNLALNWTKRDTEYLIRGEIPSKYFNIKK